LLTELPGVISAATGTERILANLDMLSVVVKSIAQDVTMATVFRGVVPFWIAFAVCL